MRTSTTGMLSILFVLYFSVRVAAQSNDSVVCVAGQCLQGSSNVTIGAKLSAPGSQTSVQLLPGQYTDATNPQLLHNLLTSSSATLAPSPGFSNATSLSLPLDLALEPGLSIYTGSRYSGQPTFSPLPSAPFGNTSTPLSAGSLSLSTNVWAAVSLGNTRIVLWEAVPDISQLAKGATPALSLLDMQSASCSPACSGSGVCSVNGTCTCPPGFAGSACETCATGFFGPTCQACPSGCTKCDEGISGSGQCLAPTISNAPSTCNCINGACGSNGQCNCLTGWTTGTNGTACAKCATGFFLSTTGACQVCGVGCSECADSTGQCTACESGLGISQTDPTQCETQKQFISQGATPCPSNTFLDGNSCSSCPTECATCTSTTQCVECAPGNYLFNGKCVSADANGLCQGANGLIADNNKKECDVCGASCLSCKYPNFSSGSVVADVQCASCIAGTFLSKGKCVSSCPSGTFVSPQDNVTCIACSSSCGTCVGTADFCLTCPTGQLSSSGQCVTTCPSNTFSSGGQCVKCHPDCATCSGPSFNQCASCPEGLPVLSSGRCLPTCTKNQFYDPTSKSCQACDSSCSSCSGAGPNSCLACASSTSVLRSGACVSANCGSASNVIPGLGVCLSELVQTVATTPGATASPLPSITGISDPTVVVGKRGLEWWEILLMALGCAFIFIAVLWLCRRRARKQRAKRTALFASKKKLDDPQGWRWRLMRFGERLFGHKASKKHPKSPSDEILPVSYNSGYDRSRRQSRASSKHASSLYSHQQDIKMKIFGSSDTKAKKAPLAPQDRDDIDMFIDSYNHSAYTRESRAPSTLPGLDQHKYNMRHHQRQIENESIYSQVTGVQRHTPEPRQPVKRGASAASRLSASTISSARTRHLTGATREGILVDLDEEYNQLRNVQYPLQMMGSGNSSGYNAAPAQSPTEAQKYMNSVRPAVVGVAQPVVGTIGPTATGGSFVPIPVTLTGAGGVGQQYWLTPAMPQQNSGLSGASWGQGQPQQQQQQFLGVPQTQFGGGASQDTVVLQPMNTGGSFPRTNPFRQGPF
ncbi:growth factor receptor domain-containing protein [Pholiota conissans]|uniref:Growth factor receptor domain-containing protein n=1 Tax=Pholiota conissans TaxID=109636 RepID=A0A9P5ZCK8_9AGAR|nr:growth factor receptor domain-containing protein [Pholiota conissans]